MRSIAREMARGVSAGEPLPSPWPVFEQRQMFFRRGAVSMIAGPPGSMKTVLALNIVRRMGPKVPTLYHSNDSDSFTVASRVLAMKQNMQTSDAEDLVFSADKAAAKSLKDFDHVRWSFRSSPSIDFMTAEAEAYRTLKGTYPHHTVVDILMNVDYEGVGDQNYWALMAELNVMAREQETAITVVHHTSESAKPGNPPPRSAIMGKANHLPTLIMTLWGDSQKGKLKVSSVKNRFGPQDPMGASYFTMRADPATCFIDESEDEMLFDSKDTETEEEW